MKTWMIFSGGSLLGAVVAGVTLAGAAQGDTGEAGRVAALEARVARLEQAVAVGADQSVAIRTSRDASVTAGKRIVLTAGDEIHLTTGKARLQMKKSGEIILSGTDITIDGAGKVSVKATSDVTVKGRKIVEN